MALDDAEDAVTSERVAALTDEEGSVLWRGDGVFDEMLADERGGPDSKWANALLPPFPERWTWHGLESRSAVVRRLAISCARAPVSKRRRTRR